ncbi:MAG: glycosyl hydrolase 53 family protein, partial [Lactobacillus delbrueckii]|nr:glycosyl hydrolase 53 family protein [Lactobacillus delbrueckii]
NADGQGYGGGNTDEESLIKTALQAKKYGMKVLLDFHYSDFWADPAKQLLPKSWKNLSSAELNEAIFLYTKKVLTDMEKAGVAPAMVQIGNEITKGTFGYDADQLTGGDWNKLWQSDYGTTVARYLATAAKAVRTANKDAKIAVQFESPDVNRYRMIMTVLKNNGVDYDYLGTSYYPFWGSSNNNPDNLLKVQEMAQKEFGKRVVVMETSWLNNVNDSDGTGNNIGYAPSDYVVGPQGQVDEVTALYKSLVAGGGVGAFYWEPAQIAVRAGWNSWNYNKQLANVYGTGWASKYVIGYAPDNEMHYNGKETWGGSTWDNMGLFDDHGYPLQSLLVYKGMLEGYQSAENTASTVTPKLSALYGADQASLKAENQLKVGQDLALTNYLDGAVAKYLNGVKGTKISEASLKALYAGLTDSLKSDQFKDEAGNNYHYEYWLEGNTSDEKLANFLKANVGATYGSPITINYTATLVKDEKVIEKASSTVEATATTVWGLDNVTIDSPMTVGQKLSAEDTDLIEKAASQYLTGEKGTEISADNFAKIAEAINAGIASSKEYQVKFTDATSVYHYVYYLDGTDLATLNKGAKYGDPIKINVSASLKWVKNL